MRLLAAIAAILLLILVACSGAGEPVFGNEQLLAGDAVVVCSQACAERGQCGERLEEGGEVVLASETGPATTGHSFVLPDQATVAIVEARAEQVVQTSDQVTFPLNFYYVTEQASGSSGWVAGWCIAGRRPP